LTCASCHPEGLDDGHTWTFPHESEQLFVRRTPSLRGGVLSTLPLHRDGEFNTLDDLASDVFAQRMGGHPLTQSEIEALAVWLDGLPIYPQRSMGSEEDVARGRVIFEKLKCASCHAGAMLTNNANAYVGTGGVFQVPTLIGIAQRAPFMHNGCAPTLLDRLVDAECGGGAAHGNTTTLSPPQLQELIYYLESL
jgi:cytochrome c peroxidase